METWKFNWNDSPDGGKKICSSGKSSKVKGTLRGRNERGHEPPPVMCSHPHTLTPSRTSLYDNNIGPEGARALAETLRTNTTLTELK